MFRELSGLHGACVSVRDDSEFVKFYKNNEVITEQYLPFHSQKIM